jgi:hypothetical protein
MLRVRVFPCAFSIALLFFLTLTNIHLSLSVCMRAPFKYCGPLRSRYLPRRSMCAAETTAKQGRVSCTPRSTAVRCVVGGFPRRLVPRKGSVLSPLRLMEFFFFSKKGVMVEDVVSMRVSSSAAVIRHIGRLLPLVCGCVCVRVATVRLGVTQAILDAFTDDAKVVLFSM